MYTLLMCRAETLGLNIGRYLEPESSPIFIFSLVDIARRTVALEAGSQSIGHLIMTPQWQGSVQIECIEFISAWPWPNADTPKADVGVANDCNN
jgi:hypothetical protein